MRDPLLVGIVIVACLMALKLPQIGVMPWSWLSIMNPHRCTYGFAYSSALAAMVAGFAVLGLLFSKKKASPFKWASVTDLILFMVWIREIVKSPAVGRVMESRAAAVFAKSFLDLMSSHRSMSVVRLLAREFGWNTTSLAQIARFRGITNA